MNRNDQSCPVCDELVNDADYFWHLNRHGLMSLKLNANLHYAGWFCICGERMTSVAGGDNFYRRAREHATHEHLKPYILLQALANQ